MKDKLPLALLALSSLTLAALAQQRTPAPIDPPVLPPVAPAPAVAPVVPPLPPVPAPIEPPIVVQAAPGAPGSAAPLPGLPGVDTLPAGATRMNDFQGDPIDLVLRTLAKQAKLNLVISDKVTALGGTVTMRLEDKSAREAIEIIVQSKGLIMDDVNGVLFVKTQEEKQAEPTVSGNFTLSYAKAKEVAPLLQSQYAMASVPQVDERTNTVFYRVGKSALESVTQFLETIDKPTQQVMIEARLVEVTANPKQSYGINWAGTVGGSATPQTFRYGGGTNTQAIVPNTDVDFVGGKLGAAQAVAPLNNVGFNPTNGGLRANDFFLKAKDAFLDPIAGQIAILSAPQLSATLRLLNEDKDSEFIANPRVVTANNQKAEIKIIRSQPVPQLNFNEQTAQAVFSGFQDKEFGNTLIVTPIINKDDFITMNVKPEISNKVGDATFAFGGAVVNSPIIDKRTLDSNVLIKSGDTLAIGGLLQDEQTKGATKVPVLGDIPLIGYLFQEKLNERTKRNLLVFVTPTVIKQGYGTGLEPQVSGLAHSGGEYADPNGWRNNAKGAVRIVPTSQRTLAADYPKPGVAKAPKKK